MRVINLPHISFLSVSLSHKHTRTNTHTHTSHCKQGEQLSQIVESESVTNNQEINMSIKSKRLTSSQFDTPLPLI